MSRSPYLSNPNILAHPDRIVETVALDLTAQETYLAGSPINAEGKLANDETAIGILLYDVRKRAGGKRGVVVVSGRINQEAAAAWCGVTISDAAKSALVNITFSDDGARMGGGSGGVPSWNDMMDRPFDKAVEEVRFVDNLTATSEYNSNYGAFVVHLGMALEQMPLTGNCKVKWDGVTRTHPIVEAEIQGEIYHGFGNLYMFSSFGLNAPNTGEPYAALILPNRWAMVFTMDQSATEHTVSVSADDTVYHPMDQRYVGFPFIDLVDMGMPDLPQAAATNIPVTFETDTADILDLLARYDIVKVRYRIDGFWIAESTGLVTVGEETREKEVAFFFKRKPYSIVVENGKITGGIVLKD